MATSLVTYPHGLARPGFAQFPEADENFFLYNKLAEDERTNITSTLQRAPLELAQYFPLLVVLCSFSTTLILNAVVHLWFVPDAAKLTSWKWKKTFVSFLHSTVAAAMMLACFYRAPMLIAEPTGPHDSLMQALLAVVIGYFLFDLMDILMNDPCSATYQLAAHHVVIIIMLSSFLFTGFAIRAGVASLAGMLSSTFQEFRKVMHIVKVPSNSRLYRTISVINIIVYVPLRFGMEFVAMRWLFLEKAYLNLHPFVTFSVVCTTMTLASLHAKGFVTIIKNDFLKQRCPPDNHMKTQ